MYAAVTHKRLTMTLFRDTQTPYNSLSALVGSMDELSINEHGKVRFEVLCERDRRRVGCGQPRLEPEKVLQVLDDGHGRDDDVRSARQSCLRRSSAADITQTPRCSPPASPVMCDQLAWRHGDQTRRDPAVQRDAAENVHPASDVHRAPVPDFVGGGLQRLPLRSGQLCSCRK